MSKKKGKEVEIVPQITDKELDEATEEVLSEVIEAEVIEEEETKEVTLVPPPPLLEQLQVHIKNLTDKTILGYSILFRIDESPTEEKVSEEETDTPSEVSDASQSALADELNKPSEVKHGMATTYPAILNQLLLGYHTNLISNEEVGFIEIIAHSISQRLLDVKKEGGDIEIIDDGKKEEV